MNDGLPEDAAERRESPSCPPRLDHTELEPPEKRSRSGPSASQPEAELFTTTRLRAAAGDDP
eukprot:2286395-Prymnesium_polylepis.1